MHQTGAKRKLTYTNGTTFFETVLESNGVDCIRFELTEHPFPCEKMFAQMSSVKVNANNTTFTVALEYKLAAGFSGPDAAGCAWALQGTAQGIADGARTLLTQKEGEDSRFPCCIL